MEGSTVKDLDMEAYFHKRFEENFDILVLEHLRLFAAYGNTVVKKESIRRIIRSDDEKYPIRLMLRGITKSLDGCDDKFLLNPQKAAEYLLEKGTDAYTLLKKNMVLI